MSDSSEQAVQQAISAISQSDPLVKLLQEVRLGRMKPADPGLRAITESWLNTYRKALETPGLSRQALLRLDPAPRVEMLVAAGVLPADHAGVTSLRAMFENVLRSASSSQP